MNYKTLFVFDLSSILTATIITKSYFGLNISTYDFIMSIASILGYLLLRLGVGYLTQDVEYDLDNTELYELEKERDKLKLIIYNQTNLKTVFDNMVDTPEIKKYKSQLKAVEKKIDKRK